MFRLPSLFISHGSPMLAIQESPAHHFLKNLGDSLPKPAAILVVSAHWETVGGPAVSATEDPETIHDFGGFPQALFEIQYPAAGSPHLAVRAAELLEQAGFSAGISNTRGLDHGAWVPLRLMYPDADIPVFQISVMRSATPAEHFRMGRALSEIQNENVLIIGSGSLTHNLYEFRGQSIDSVVPAWVKEFDGWMKERIKINDLDALLNYRDQAPFAAKNHPTEEHLLPLFVALGAGGESVKPKHLHSSYEYGILAMDMFAFGAEN